MPRPDADGAGAEVAGQVVGHEPERRLVQGHVHLAALAGLLALVQRAENAERSPHAGALVGDRHACADAVAAGFARDADDPAGRLGQRVVAGTVAPGPGAAEGADRAVDEPRVPHRATRRRRGRAPRPGPGAGSGRRRPPGRRGAASPRGRGAGRCTRSACSRSRSGTACSPRPRTAAPRCVPRRRRGGSILTTSAPSAPRTSVQYGPASDVVTSTTRMPRSGRKLHRERVVRLHVFMLSG